VSIRTTGSCLKILMLCVMVAVLSAAAAAQIPVPAIDVKVVNTPSVTVSNTPSVTVTNTPTVTVGNTPTVTVGNTPSVTVTNTPNVTLSNTNTTPVFTSNTDQPGRIAYQSQVDNTATCSGNNCFFDFPNAPGGQRVVVEHVSGLIDFATTPTLVLVTLNNGSGEPVSSFLAPVLAGAGLTAFDQPVLAYFDPSQFGGIIEVQVSLFGGTFSTTGGAQIVNLSGYELSCNSATPCSPIAH